MNQSESRRARWSLLNIAALSLALLGFFGCSSEDAGPTPAQQGAGSSATGGAPGGPGSGAGGGLGSAGSNPGTVAGSPAGAGSSCGPSSSAGACGTPDGNGGNATVGGTAGGSSSGGNGGDGNGGDPAGGGTKPIKVWISGDSTLQDCSGACPCGWGSQFDPLFNDNVTVVNSAAGGRSIQTWLYEAAVSSKLGTDGECTLSSTNYDKRWTAMLDANSGVKAGDYLFIQFGINDGDSTCPRHVGQARFKSLLASMAAAAKERGAQAVFVTPVSAISCSGSIAQPTRGFVTTTKDAATASAVPVIDLHQLSIDLYTSLGLCPNNGNYSAGKVGDFFCADHTHFEAGGAKQIAGSVAGALKSAGIRWPRTSNEAGTPSAPS